MREVGKYSKSGPLDRLSQSAAIVAAARAG